MAEGILGLASGQGASLNQELIDKLKAAEQKARVEPIEKDIEDITKEREVFSTIDTKVGELLDAIKPFDLFVSGGVNAFDQKAATTSGDSVTFNAVDATKLNKGVTTVNIDTLAQKDVYQSNAVNAATKDALGDIGTLTIDVAGKTLNFNTADFSTYDELVDQINTNPEVNASVEQVGTDSYRLVLKSADSGLDNKLTISGAASQALGYTTDGTTVNATNQLLTAQDMKAFVDGVEYNVSSNKLTVDGLEMTATKTGISTINITDDNTQIQAQVENFITKYNELVDLVDGEAFDSSSSIKDKSAIRSILTQIKDKLFGEYGPNDKSLFNYGFEIDKAGKLSLDTKTFSTAISDDLEGLKELFVGTAANEGLGTQLKTVLDEMNFSDGVLTSYLATMDSREETLNKEKEKAEETLNNKYSQLANQFAAYGAIINQFEASFSGLKMMIQQSTTSG